MNNIGLNPTPADAIQHHLCIRLIELRLKQGLSSTDVDERARQPAGTCQRLQQGGGFFGATEIYALARAVEVDPSYFFDGLPVRHKKERSLPILVGDPKRAQEAEDLIVVFQGIADPGLRKSVLNLVTAVADNPSRANQLIPPT